MGIVLEEERSGFTIIEVMLFLALSGFMLLGIFVGAGSNIANQRYKDAVQDASDALRKAYSFVADTQIETRDENNSACKELAEGRVASRTDEIAEVGRGRTSCAVYGAVVTISKDTIQTTTLIGVDYRDVTLAKDHSGKKGDEELYNHLKNATSDLDILYWLGANNLAKLCNGDNTTCWTVVAGNSATQKLKWEANFKKPNDPNNPGAIKNRDLELTLIIYRSPRDGSVHTLVMQDLIKANNQVVDYRNIPTNDPTAVTNYGVNRYLSDPSPFKQEDVYFCIDSGGAGTYAEHNRIIHITKDAKSQSGIILENLDEDITDSNGKAVSCDK